MIIINDTSKKLEIVWNIKLVFMQYLLTKQLELIEDKS